MRSLFLLLWLFCASLAGGCATNVTRTTPEEMRAAPGATLRITSPTAYDRAFTKTRDQLMACFQRVIGSTQVAVTSDKSETESHLTLGMSSLFGYRIIATMTLRPVATGTDLVLYATNELWLKKLQHGLTTWLLADAVGCPDDAAPAVSQN